jgi:hypothetical protein
MTRFSCCLTLQVFGVEHKHVLLFEVYNQCSCSFDKTYICAKWDGRQKISVAVFVPAPSSLLG